MGHIDQVHCNVTNSMCDECVYDISLLSTSYHTQNNICEECGKGFVSKSKLMNT